MNSHRKSVLATAALVCLIAVPAQAYVGPGAGLSAIGTLLALLATLILAAVGFVWYPLKRLLRKSKQQPVPPSQRRHGGRTQA